MFCPQNSQPCLKIALTLPILSQYGSNSSCPVSRLPYLPLPCLYFSLSCLKTLPTLSQNGSTSPCPVSNSSCPVSKWLYFSLSCLKMALLLPVLCVVQELTVKKEEKGTWHLSVFSHYWMVNKTGLTLEYKAGDSFFVSVDGRE